VDVALRGNSASAVTAGILLLTQARRLGHPIGVSVEGDPDDVAAVEGPTIVYSPVLAGCGVGRQLGSGPLVIVPGPASTPLALSLDEGGGSDWFFVDRRGVGEHASTQAFVRLCTDRGTEARNLGRQLRRTLGTIGCTPEPALLDLLFGAPAAPPERIAMTLRAGRAMTGSPGDSLIRFVSGGHAAIPDPLPSPCSADDLQQAWDDGRMQAFIDRLSLGVRDGVEDWVEGMKLVPCHEKHELMCGLAEVGSHLVSLPNGAMLPPLDAAKDAISVGLGAALGATSGQTCANRALVEMFQFLGGRFVENVRYAVPVPGIEPPTGRLERWQWLCRGVREAQATADQLWRQVVDPLQ